MNSATRYQTIDGFGAAVSIWGSAWSTAETQTLVGLGANQLGLSIVRTGISPVSSEWATQVSALKTAKSYGSGVKILASPWTAPAAWKTNNSRINGGKLKTDYYDDYANHLNSYVQYMREPGRGDRRHLGAERAGLAPGLRLDGLERHRAAQPSSATRARR